VTTDHARRAGGVTLDRDAVSELAEDVRAGLGREGQKTLPSRWLYDDLGTALFQAICRVPEYGLTRADARILNAHADEIVALAGLPARVAELGSGTGEKTRAILESLGRRGSVTYIPIDVSALALATCEAELAGVPGVSIETFEGEYLEGLAHATATRRPGERMLVLFVGSTIGNFDRGEGDAFLRKVRRRLRSGDALLLGTDLVKEVPRLIAAYDDPAGVTAAFDKNVLARLNRELHADFRLDRFAHEARWNPDERRIEMHLRSLGDQTASVPGAALEVVLREGETIWTESSHKYAPDELPAIARRAGFRCAGSWFDREWPFAESLFVAEGA
jgi:dimethylhistidine N-methyltransferase